MFHSPPETSEIKTGIVFVERKAPYGSEEKGLSGKKIFFQLLGSISAALKSGCFSEQWMHLMQ